MSVDGWLTYGSCVTACGSYENNALVLSMILVATVTNFLDVPLLTVVLPVYARDNYGSAASFGGIVGALAAGAFLGTLVFGAVGRRLPAGSPSS